MATFLTALLAIAVAFGTSFVVAVGFLFFQDWFGSGDLAAFAFWTFPAAIGLALVALPFRTWRRKVAVPLAIILGPAFGYGFTLAVAVMLGPWFGAFSFPPLYCWMTGGLAALLVGALVPRITRPHHHADALSPTSQ